MVLGDMKIIKTQISDTKLGFTDYSRKLLEEGEKEDTRLEFYREDMLCLYGEIGRAAKLTIRENNREGPKHTKYVPFPTFK
jgi:hypothetical protein